MAYHVVLLFPFFAGKFLTLVMPLSLGIAVGGAVWAWLYERTGSIYAPWLSHLIIDVAIFAVGYDLIFVKRM
jgi:membrane protease YdiL (CAAX protease family)